MDGNGRWGLKKKNSRNYGHLQGIKAVETIIKSSINMKIPFLTLYTFSTENWKRPDSEINFLFSLIRKSLKKKLSKIIGTNPKIPMELSDIKFLKKIQSINSFLFNGGNGCREHRISKYY